MYKTENSNAIAGYHFWYDHTFLNTAANISSVYAQDNEPDVTLTALLGGQAVQRIVAFAISADLAAQREGG